MSLCELTIREVYHATGQHWRNWRVLPARRAYKIHCLMNGGVGECMRLPDNNGKAALIPLQQLSFGEVLLLLLYFFVCYVAEVWQLMSYATAIAFCYLSALLFISTTGTHTYVHARLLISTTLTLLLRICVLSLSAVVVILVATNAIIIAHFQRCMSAGVYLLICRSISAIGNITPSNAVRSRRNKWKLTCASLTLWQLHSALPAILMAPNVSSFSSFTSSCTAYSLSLDCVAGAIALQGVHYNCC